MVVLRVGDRAPEFDLQDQEGKYHTLARHRGSWVLLYFYPKDDTPGCTTEACTIRDQFSEFQKHDIVVLGVSTDSVESHQKFAAKYTLPFPLLSDASKVVVNAYGVYAAKQVMGQTTFGSRRQSFLIDPHGKIVKIYASVEPTTHASDVLEDINVLQHAV